MPYIKNQQIFVCPSGPSGVACYGMNYYMAAYARAECGSAGPSGYGYGGCALAAICRPAEILILTDARALATSPCYYIGNAVYPGYAYRTAGYICGGTVPRHNDGVNCTYADGHAKWQQGIKFEPVNNSNELRNMLYFWVP
jgi:prepilin-type processing-associated H-X9-DG protein